MAALSRRQRLFPSLYTNAAQLKALGIKGDSDDKRVRGDRYRHISLLQMQRENGGFALWDKKGPEEYWLTAYAMDFLVRAGEQGYSVPADAINNANNRLLRYLQDPGMMSIRYSDDTQASKFAVQAYAALVLARQQKRRSAPCVKSGIVTTRRVRLAADAARHGVKTDGRCAAQPAGAGAGGQNAASG
jgi:uncharacterized protein YfaS (alpha-2-macroglobulin family)